MRYCGPSRASDAKAFSRNGSELAFWGEICGECYFDSMVVGYDVSLCRSLPFGWRGPRDFQWLSARVWQRVCSGIAGCWQSLHRPCSLSLLRFSAARFRPLACRSSTARRTRFGFLDVLGFSVLTVVGFEAFRSRAGAAFGLADLLVLRLEAGLGS